MNNVKIAQELVKIAKALGAEEEHPYHEHFREKLEEQGINSPSELPTDEAKKSFFENVSDEWKGHPENTEASEMVYPDDASKVASELVKIARALSARDVDFSEVKQKLKAIGFDARIKSMSWGPHLVLVDSEGNKDAGNVYSEESRAKWKPAHDVIREFANDNVTYKGMKVIGFKKG